MWDHVHVRDMNKKGCVVAESSNVYLSAVEKGLSLFYTLQGVLFFGFVFFFHLAFFSKLLITWCHTVWKNSLAGGVQRSLWMTDWSLVFSCEGQAIRPLPLRGCDRIYSSHLFNLKVASNHFCPLALSPIPQQGGECMCMMRRDEQESGEMVRSRGVVLSPTPPWLVI